MAMKKVFVNGKYMYIDATHATRLQTVLTQLDEGEKQKAAKNMAKKQDRDRKIAREMKEKGMGPRGFGSQLAGWVPSKHKNIEKSPQTIDGNPLVYSL